MSALGSLVVKLALEYAQYTGGLDKSEQATLASLKRIQAGADQFSAKVGDSLKTGLGGLAAFFTAGALSAQVKAVVDDLDRIADTAAAIGVATQSLAELGYAAKLSGTDAQTLEGAMGKLNLKISDAVGGNKEAAKLFRELGVELKDANGQVRATDAVLADLSDTFKLLPEGPTKSALAVELFGKSGAGLLQFLRQGSDGINGLRAEFVALSGGSIEQAAEQAGAFNDQLDKLAVLGQAATIRFGSELLPTLTEVASMFTATGEDAIGLGAGMDTAALAGQGLRSLLEMVILLGSDVAFVFNGMGREIGGIVAQFNALGEGGGIFTAAGRKAWGDVGEAMRSDAEEARRKLDAFQARLVAAPQRANTSPEDAAEKRRNDEKRRTSKEAQDASARARAALATEGEGAKAAADGYEKLIQSIRARMALADQQLALGRELTEGEKFEAKAKEDLAKIAATLSGGKVAAAEREIAAVKARIEQVEIERKIEKELMAVAQERQRLRNADADSVAKWLQAQEEAAATTLQSIKDRLDGLRDEEDALVLSRQLNIGLAEAVERLAVARLREKQERVYEGSDEWERLQREIDAREKLLGLLSRKELREREDRAWTDFFGSIDRTAHDTFVNVFEDGAGSFKRLGQTLKASVLDVLYQMTVRRWMINISTSIFGGGFGAAAQAATGGAGALGGIGSIGNGFSLLSGLGGAFGGGVAGGFGGLMGSLGLSSAGTTLGGALSAGSIALQSGNILGGLGTFVGALGPIALGIGALVSILGKDDSGTFHTGALSEYSAATGAANSTTHGAFGMGFGGVDASSQTQQFTSGLARSISQLLDSTAAAFGKDGGYRVATAFADDTSEDGAWGGLLISRLEETLLNWDDTRTSRWAPREFADGEEGQKQYLAELAKGVRSVLDDIGLPGWATGMLDALGEGASIEQLAAAVEQISRVKAVFADFGQYMPAFASLADSAVSALVKASGGVDALTTNLSTFVANFMSEEDRMAVATANVAAELAKLGFEMPRTREEFAALVQAQWALGDAGASTAARLLGISGAFASVTQSAEELARVAKESLATRLDEAYSALEKSLALERKALQDQVALRKEAAESVRSVFELLHGTVRDLRGQGDATRELQALEGERFIVQAQLAARAGALPDAADMGEAISAVRDGIEGRVYANELDREFDRMVLTNRLEDMEGVAGKQLTAEEQLIELAERELSRIDESLDFWKQQIDLAKGTQESVLSGTEAMQAILALLQKAKAPQGDGKGSGAVVGDGGFSSGPSGGGGSMPAPDKASEIRSMFDGWDLTDLRGAAVTASLKDWSQQDIADAYKVSVEDLQRMFAEQGIPAFADGGWHSGGWALVGERGPELAYMPPAQIYDTGRSRQMLQGYGAGGSTASNSQLVSQLASLGSAIGAVKTQCQRTADLLQTFTRGGIGPALVKVAPSV